MSDFQIKYYRIHLGHGTHTARDGGEVIFRAYIEVGGFQQNGAQKAVKIFFLGEESRIPPKAGYRAGDDDWLYAPMEEMPVYIDLLRNEKPTWIRVDINDAANTRLMTVWEEAGEGE